MSAKVALILVFAVAMAISIIPAQAQPNERASITSIEQSPSTVKVSVYVLNIGKFDVESGSYTVDFYLDFRCEKACEPGNFEFSNGRASSMDLLINDPTEKFYRIQASLSQNIDLRNYPFDSHTLTIELEDKTQTVENQIYEDDNVSSGIDPSVVLVGWELNGWTSNVSEHYYSPYNETYSRYIFGLNIGRVGLTSILKSFLPVFFMVLISLLSLLLTADKLTTRLSLNISTLLAAVMFHLNLTSSIPPTGYLTFADKFMIVTYIILMVVLFSGIDLMRHTDMKDEAQANRIFKISLVGIPIFTFFAYLVTFLVL